MGVELRTPDSWPLEVLDRVLDRGLVIEAERTTPSVGLGLIEVDARVRVTRLEPRLGPPAPTPPAARAA